MTRLPMNKDRFSRRALLRRMGVGAAMLPLIHAERALGQSEANPFPKRLVLATWTNGVIKSSFYPAGNELSIGATLKPLEIDTILGSVEKTGRCVIVHEAPLTGGFGAEIAARIADDCFAWLDAPVKRVASTDTFVGYAPRLEDAILPQVRADVSCGVAATPSAPAGDGEAEA